MFGQLKLVFLALLFMVSLCRQAGAVTPGTTNGTYDFGSLSTIANSAGAGYVKLGDKFKVGNGLFSEWDGILTPGTKTAIYGSAVDINGVDPAVIILLQLHIPW